MTVLLTILAAIFVFGIVILIHEGGHFVTAKLCGIKVNEFALGMGPKLFSFGKKETKYSLRLLPIGGFVSMEGEDEESDDPRGFQKAPVWKRILVIVAGAFMNLVLGFVVLVIMVSSDDAIASRTISSFYENATSQATGLQLGDTILSVNGRKCFIADDILYEFARIDADSIELEVLRDGKKVTLPAVHFDSSPDEDGLNLMIVDFTVLPVEKNVGTVLREGWYSSLSYARLIFLSLWDLATGRVPVNQLSGPVGIVSTIASVVSYGWQPLLMLLALITLNLGIFNLLPLPALDGGKLLLLVVEAVRRRPLNEKYEAIINVAGFALLMVLMVFATFNDIVRLVKGG